jgi:hypothetical protein
MSFKETVRGNAEPLLGGAALIAIDLLFFRLRLTKFGLPLWVVGAGFMAAAIVKIALVERGRRKEEESARKD